VLGTRDLTGYARVSTDEQNLDLQLDALEAAGGKRIPRRWFGIAQHRPSAGCLL
jgi:DNA invertase Pin-like site-specific DNA recombinase